jgi:hypothetical protein
MHQYLQEKIANLEFRYLFSSICIWQILNAERQQKWFQRRPLEPDNTLNSNKKAVSLKFEIIDIYPGEKYKDTAITEINLNYDQHCH